jgi:hypothetical protein
MSSMHTSPVMAHSLTKGDIIEKREGVFVRIIEQPCQYGGKVALIATQITPRPLIYGTKQLIFFDVNAPVDRVVGARSAGL